VDLTVVFNTRDRPERLRLVLTALRQQREVPGGLRVIVVDDGSTLDLSPALRDHDGLDVQVIRLPPSGYTAARNAGLRAADGDVILCLDDDVIFGPDLVATHLRAHFQNPSAVVVGDRYNTFRSDLDSAESRALIESALAGDWTPLGRWSRRDYYAAQTLKLFDTHPNALPAPWLCFVSRNVSFRQADGRAVGWYDEDFRRWGVDDIEMGLRLHRAGVRYHYRPQARVYHLETPIAADKLDALNTSLDHFAAKHPGVEAPAFRDFVFGRRSLEELCASVEAGRLVDFPDRAGLTFFQTRR
jgi:GT2 family glycosyltransferase